MWSIVPYPRKQLGIVGVCWNVTALLHNTRKAIRLMLAQHRYDLRFRKLALSHRSKG